MFDESYPFKFKFKLSPDPHKDAEDILQIYIYDFSASRERYIVKVEEYSDCIFAVKFYPYTLRDSNNKYYSILNRYDNASVTAKIIRTCVNISLDMLHKFPSASFGIVATPIVLKKDKEKISNNKRFRIYRYVITSFFGDDQFYHLSNENQSAYLLMNKQVDDPINAAHEAVKMFIRNYPELDELN